MVLRKTGSLKIASITHKSQQAEEKRFASETRELVSPAPPMQRRSLSPSTSFLSPILFSILSPILSSIQSLSPILFSILSPILSSIQSLSPILFSILSPILSSIQSLSPIPSSIQSCPDPYNAHARIVFKNGFACRNSMTVGRPGQFIDTVLVVFVGVDDAPIRGIEDLRCIAFL